MNQAEQRISNLVFALATDSLHRTVANMDDRERTETTVVRSTCRQRLRVSRNGNRENTVRRTNDLLRTLMNMPRRTVTASNPTSDYALGSTDAEHERQLRSLAS